MIKLNFRFLDITLNEGQAKVVSERYVNNGVIYQIDGILTVETDLRENTVMDVVQDLGCDIVLDYLFDARVYDMLRADSKYKGICYCNFHRFPQDLLTD